VKNLTTGTVSKGGKDSTNIRSRFISTVWYIICVVYSYVEKISDFFEKLEDLFLLKNTAIYIGREHGINNIFDSPV
jgi:hypothetical protein